MNKHLTKAAALTLVATLIATTAIGPGSAIASGWVDDWITSKTVSGPSSYEGSKRNYYSGGSFSARWATSNDHLFSISPPRLRSGCGGIDMFLGGFDFLNVDYLVDKLQRILAAAPAAAFDIALKTLAPQVAETIKTLEGIIDRLNNLQLDDCKSAKAIVATVASQFTPDGATALNAELKSAQADFMASSGVGNLWYGVSSMFNAEKKGTSATTTTKDSAKGATANCPAEIKTIFGDGSIVDNAAAKMGMPSSYANLIRGLMGDVIVKTPDATGSTYKAEYVAPCGENTGKTLDAFLTGKAYGKSATASACTQISDSKADLQKYVNDTLTSIAGKMKNKTALSSSEEAFLQGTPMSLGLMLRTAVSTRTETTIVPQLSEVMAKGYAYYMVLDLYGRVSQMMEMTKQMITKQTGSTSGSSDDCNLTLLSGAIKQFQELETSHRQLIVGLRAEYAASVQESMTLQGYVDSLRQYEAVWRSEINKRFGSNGKDPAFANRI